MKRLLFAAIAVLSIVSLARADIYCGVAKHDGEAPLWNPSASYFVSGNELYDWCTHSNWALCDGFVEGSADIFIAQNANSVCMPTGQSGVTVQEVVDVVKKYLTNHPETRHYPAYSIILVALDRAFPCKS